ncbi:hypothetical protein Bbelb_015680 [Branchiostoma belcheri]|nr:hypothetical protein Bbelb_015680 [Branchiostoma belcheri]
MSVAVIVGCQEPRDVVEGRSPQCYEKSGFGFEQKWPYPDSADFTANQSHGDILPNMQSRSVLAFPLSGLPVLNAGGQSSPSHLESHNLDQCNKALAPRGREGIDRKGALATSSTYVGMPSTETHGNFQGPRN